MTQGEQRCNESEMILVSKHHCQGNQRIQGALETDEETKPKQPAPRQTLGKGLSFQVRQGCPGGL